jgi:competence protein ComEC
MGYHAGMKRPAFFIACALVAGAVCGRAIVLPWYVSAGAIALLLGGAVWCWARSGRAAGREAGGQAGEGPGGRAEEGLSVPRIQSRVTRLVLGAFFALALLQQNAEVQRERISENQVARLQRTGEITFRGTVSEEPSVLRGGDRAVLVLRDLEIVGTPQEEDIPLPDKSSVGVPPADRSSVGVPPATQGATSDRRRDARATLAPNRGERLACRLQVSLLRSAAAAFRENLPFQGQRIEIAGTLREPLSSRHQDLFDYGAYLRSQGISAQASVWDPERVRRVDEEDATVETAVFSRLMGWRRAVLRQMDQSLEPEKAAVAKAMLFGDTSGFDDGLRSIFIRSGIAHLFAVSGSHTAMLALIIFCLCRLLQIPPRVSVWILYVVMAVFCALVGFLPPVVRGTIMAYCMALPILSRRAVDSLEAFSIAVMIALILKPLSILRPDFQLTYLCVLGMITLLPTLSEIVSVVFTIPWNSYGRRRLAHHYNGWIYNGWMQIGGLSGGGLAITIAAQLAVIPLLSLYFHQVSLIGFVANLVLVPFSGVLLVVAGAFSLLGTAGGELTQAMAVPLSLVSGIFIALTRFFAGFPCAVTYLPSFSWWMVLVYYLLLFSGPHMRLLRAPGAREIRRGRLLLHVAAIVAIVAWWPVVAHAVAGEPDPGFQLTMLDVGQGDCFVLRLPDARVVMVDTGKPQAARTILEYLKAQNVDEVAALVLTHSDSDHIGAAPQILDKLYVGVLLVGTSASESGAQRELDEAVARWKVPVCRVARGDTLGGSRDMRLEILNPARESGTDRAMGQRGGLMGQRGDLMGQGPSYGTPSDRQTGEPADWPTSMGQGPSYGRAKGDPNDQSVVLLAEYGEMTFLLTGDAGTAAEKEMLSACGAKALEAEVLKPGHHGSRTASCEEFVSAVHPWAALISAGARNQYGHPTPEVVERLQRAGAAVLNTAECGSVDLRTDGRRLWIRVTRTGGDKRED